MFTEFSDIAPHIVSKNLGAKYITEAISSHKTFLDKGLIGSQYSQAFAKKNLSVGGHPDYDYICEDEIMNGQVATMFVDLVNFSRLLLFPQAISPIEVVHLKKGFVNICCDAVKFFGFGHVHSITGDGLMVFYGGKNSNPLSDCERALNDALSINYIIRNFLSPKLAKEGNEDLIKIRIGIDQSDVYWHRAGNSEISEVKAAGVGVDFAAKCESDAGAWRIMLGEGVLNQLEILSEYFLMPQNPNGNDDPYFVRQFRGETARRKKRKFNIEKYFSNNGKFLDLSKKMSELRMAREVPISPVLDAYRTGKNLAVTSTGQVILENKKEKSKGEIILKHRNDGGFIPVLEGSEKLEVDTKVIKLIKNEILKLRAKFPQFEVIDDNRGVLTFEGSFTNNFHRKYRLRVVFPSNYPKSKPRFYSNIRGFRRRLKHVYSDGSLCLDENYFIKNHSLSFLVAWACEWHFNQEYYQMTGKWPAPESKTDNKKNHKRRTRHWH